MLSPGENFNPRGIEARAGSELLAPGKRIGYAEIALLAMVGREQRSGVSRNRASRFSRPATRSSMSASSRSEFQIRNSNAWSLAAQVAPRRRDIPKFFPSLATIMTSTRALIDRGLQSDLLLLSGGVSAGKYDIVERVLADLGAKFFSIAC